MTFAVPTIASIQRTNFILVVVSSAILALFASASLAVGCMLGGTVVIANLWILSALGGLLLAASSAGVSGAAAKLGALAVPLKLDRHVFRQGIGRTERIDLHGMIDHEIDRHQRIDPSRIAAEPQTGQTIGNL